MLVSILHLRVILSPSYSLSERERCNIHPTPTEALLEEKYVHNYEKMIPHNTKYYMRPITAEVEKSGKNLEEGESVDRGQRILK